MGKRLIGDLLSKEFTQRLPTVLEFELQYLLLRYYRAHMRIMFSEPAAKRFSVLGFAIRPDIEHALKEGNVGTP
jgi:hypothetical protein